METGERRTLHLGGPAARDASRSRTGRPRRTPTRTTIRSRSPMRAGNAIEITYQPGALDQENPRSRAIAADRGHARAWSRSAATTRSGRVVAVTQRRERERGPDLQRRLAGRRRSRSRPAPRSRSRSTAQHGHWLDMDGAVSDKRSFDTTGNPTVESAKGRRGGVLNQQFDANRALATLDVAARTPAA